MPKPKPQVDCDNSAQASAIALNFIAFLATETPRLQQFCALTGLRPHDFRSRLDSPDFQALALDYLLQDESLLIAFSKDCGIPPEIIAAARRHLPGFLP